MSGSSLENIMSGQDRGKVVCSQIAKDMDSIISSPSYRASLLDQLGVIDVPNTILEEFFGEAKKYTPTAFPRSDEELDRKLPAKMKSLDSISEDGRKRDLHGNIFDTDAKMPPLLTRFGETTSNDYMPTTSSQSDEELARKLAAEWASMPDEGPVVDHQDIKSDEEYARKLQAMWDAETSGNQSAVDLCSQVATTTEDVASLASDGSPLQFDWNQGVKSDADDMEDLRAIAADYWNPVPPTKEVVASSSSPPPEAKTTESKQIANDATARTAATNSAWPSQVDPFSSPKALDFEKHGLSFPLFHYNGLRGGNLTCFRISRLSPTEAVGASIASSSKGGTGCGAGGCELEDVVRTKWPSCLVKWYCEKPPSID